MGKAVNTSLAAAAAFIAGLRLTAQEPPGPGGGLVQGASGKEETGRRNG
jgi:hypothetical protein